MVGRHDERSAGNVYRRLYRDLGLSDPPGGEREKPPCCDERGDAPVNDPEVEEFETAVRAFRRRRQRGA
jgi:hypothetical protein